jgi:glycosyltransferase involved in cell wall biosynthesis
LRILAFVKHYAGYGHNAGAETTLHDLLRLLVNEGHQCTVLLAKYHSGVSSYTTDGVDVISPKSASECKHLPFQLFPEADIIITQLSASGRAGILAKQFGKPSLHYAHNDLLHNELNSRKYTDLTIYNTRWVQDQWSLPGMVLHPIVEPPRYRVETSQEYITLVNLSIGDDCNYNKGHETFYELAKRLPEEKFLGVKGAYGNQRVEELDNVTILEHQSDMTEVYKKTKLILLPSEYESYGRVPVEAAASGIPSVVTDQPGVREAIGPAGIYRPFGDIDGWEEAVEYVLLNYDSRRVKASARSTECWERSQSEIDEFTLLLEILDTDGLETAKEYLEVPVAR